MIKKENVWDLNWVGEGIEIKESLGWEDKLGLGSLFLGFKSEW